MSEDANKLVELRRVANVMIAGMLVSRLQEEGIEAAHFNYDSVALGAFGATGFMPRSVMVRREDVERANSVLERIREESIDINWDEVDVGEPADGLARQIAADDRRVSRLPRSWRRIIFVLGMAFLIVFLCWLVLSVLSGEQVLPW